MKEPVWLRPEAVLIYHDMQIQQHGGSYGVRDENLLISAIARPQNLFAYGKPSIFEMAASLAFGIAKNHPFVDGNKRTASMCAITFLELNNCNFQATQEGLVLETVKLAEGAISEKEFSMWLEKNSIAN